MNATAYIILSRSTLFVKLIPLLMVSIQTYLIGFHLDQSNLNANSMEAPEVIKLFHAQINGA